MRLALEKSGHRIWMDVDYMRGEMDSVMFTVRQPKAGGHCTSVHVLICAGAFVCCVCAPLTILLVLIKRCHLLFRSCQGTRMSCDIGWPFFLWRIWRRLLCGSAWVHLGLERNPPKKNEGPCLDKVAMLP